jgi:LmbE family N-acetylglucosaminyl deacetylase
MGVAMRENMNFKDGFFKDDEHHKIALIKKIRQYQPKIVITNAVSDRHPDHVRGSHITVDACYLSGLEKIDTGQEVWRPDAIYHYIQFNNLTADIVVDITNQIKLKLLAKKAYSTQFYNPDSKESNTIQKKYEKKNTNKKNKNKRQTQNRQSENKGKLLHNPVKVLKDKNYEHTCF